MGFPPQFFTVLFAVPRVAGYLAHWREALADPETKIVRPQQDYVGRWLEPYVPLAARPEEGSGGDELGPVPPSAAYTRRVAGTNWG
jgi:citrate synthase